MCCCGYKGEKKNDKNQAGTGIEEGEDGEEGVFVKQSLQGAEGRHEGEHKKQEERGGNLPSRPTEGGTEKPCQEKKGKDDHAKNKHKRKVF